jgi:DNA polymerase-3 subunit gamma/tau
MNQPMADTAYQVVARRYRPQRFAELVGQEHVARGLSGAIESGRIGHAYLFTGARGTGKTSAARIFAKALECARGPAGEPCNDCDACRAIAAGQDVDVVEIDAASNRGIDEMRQLRQNVAVRPARGRFKIYIIDEVHMLTREAFNALLKTLEEPPAHVKFVLCTTEPEKLPITILSRCQRFDFTTVETAAIARRLAQIVEAEGANVSAEALHLIARRAAGSMRDSQSLLEQLLGAAAGPIGVDDVHAVIGTGREERIGAVVAAVAARDAAAALAALDEALAGGADAGGVLDQLVAALRDCLLASVGAAPELMTQGEGLGVDLPAVGRQLGTATVLAMLQILDQAMARMRTSGHPAVLAEMAVVRLARLEDLESLAAVIDKIAAGGPVPAAEPRPVPARSAAAASSTATTTTTATAGTEREKKTTDRAEPAVEPPTADQLPAVPAPEPVAPTAGLPVDAAAAWRAGTEAFGGLAADLAETATSVAWCDGVLEVTMPGAAGTAAAYLRRPEVAAGIGKALSELAGRAVRFTLVVTPAAAGRAAAAASRPTPVVSQATLLREAAEHPLVAHARTLFDAAIRKVDPPRPREPARMPEPALTAGAVAEESAAADHDDASGAGHE